MNQTAQSVFQTWWPVTHDIGLARADVETVVEARLQEYKNFGEDPKREDLHSDSLEDALRKLEPLSPAPTRGMYLATPFGWTLFLRNATRGSDPAGPMQALARALMAPAMRVCLTPPHLHWQAVMWEVFDGADPNSDADARRRSIAVV